MRARVVVGLVVISLVAAVGAAAPGSGAKVVAAESLSATSLSITPQVAYERAMLRVTGPKGYHGRQKFEAGAAIQVDLTSFGKRPTGIKSQVPKTEKVERPSMPDGRYKFEVAFYANGRKAGVHTGMFFVEGGLTVSREAKRAQLSALRGDLARDRQSLAARGGRPQMSTERSGAPFSTDASAPQISSEAPSPEGVGVGGYLFVYPYPTALQYTWAGLGNYNSVLYTNQVWSMVHSYGDLNFKFGGYPYPYGFISGYPYTQVGFEPAYPGVQGAEVGIGTPYPYANLDVVGSYYYYGPRQLAINGWYGYQASQGLGGAGLWFYDDDGQPIVSFNHAANPFTLVVDAQGVGIGDFTYYPYVPTEDLHVFAEDPQVLVEATGAPAGRTLAYLKNPGDVRMFWENTDSGDIWQMSMLSTVLQMASPTGVGKFRVRKNAGLQALNGSTTILDLDSAGNLDVTSVTETSSREAKNGFESVDGLSVLEKVAGLPISEWSYKADNPSVRHLGPMAEDFHAAFGLGKTDKGITSVDTTGVALAAIQGLNQKLAAKDARIGELEQRLLELEELVQALAEH